MSIKVLKSLAAFALGAAVFAQPALAQDKPLKVGVTCLLYTSPSPRD